MGLIKDLLTKTIAQLTNITNAAYPGDVSGTDANKEYFEGNVHPYLKDVGKYINATNIFYVSPAYADMEDPCFETLADAHTASTGSSASNRRLIKLRPGTYSDPLSLDKSGYIIVAGEDRSSCQITGTVEITAGVYIFYNCHFEGNITISGGVAVFINCSQKTGNTALSSGATLIINNSPYWGYVTANDDDNYLYLEDIKGMAKNGSSQSIYLDSSVTAGDYTFDDVAMQGTFTNDGSIAIGTGTGEIQVSGLKPNRRARPEY